MDQTATTTTTVEWNINGCHAGDIELQAAAAAVEPGEAATRCVLCTEPLEWAAVGRCGHAVLCPLCMVRVRVTYRNKRCIFCRARCPKVAVVRRDSAAAVDVSALPFTLVEGHLEGRRRSRWYYSLRAAAYFDDEEQYEKVSDACSRILRPFYEPLIAFAGCYIFCLTIGVSLGFNIASNKKDTRSRVTILVGTILLCLLLGTLSWFGPTFCPCREEDEAVNDDKSQNSYHPSTLGDLIG